LAIKYYKKIEPQKMPLRNAKIWVGRAFLTH